MSLENIPSENVLSGRALWKTLLKPKNRQNLHILLDSIQPDTLAGMKEICHLKDNTVTMGPIGLLALEMIEDTRYLESREWLARFHLVDWLNTHLPSSCWSHESLPGIPDRELLFVLMDICQTEEWQTHTIITLELEQKKPEDITVLKKLAQMFPEKTDHGLQKLEFLFTLFPLINEQKSNLFLCYFAETALVNYIQHGDGPFDENILARLGRGLQQPGIRETMAEKILYGCGREMAFIAPVEAAMNTHAHTMPEVTASWMGAFLDEAYRWIISDEFKSKKAANHTHVFKPLERMLKAGVGIAPETNLTVIEGIARELKDTMPDFHDRLMSCAVKKRLAIVMEDKNAAGKKKRI